MGRSGADTNDVTRGVANLVSLIASSRGEDLGDGLAVLPQVRLFAWESETGEAMQKRRPGAHGPRSRRSGSAGWGRPPLTVRPRPDRRWCQHS
jgi:hypothetical protein